MGRVTSRRESPCSVPHHPENSPMPGFTFVASKKGKKRAKGLPTSAFPVRASLWKQGAQKAAAPFQSHTRFWSGASGDRLQQ